MGHRKTTLRMIQINAGVSRFCATAHEQRVLPMIVAVLSALAEPTRLAAMRLLEDGGEHCVCELMHKLGTTQSRMSRQMQVLKQAELVVHRRDAQWVRYRIRGDLPLHLRTMLGAGLVEEVVA
jgi:ArsR family transcriptional regulator